MSIQSEAQLEKLKAIGAIVRKALDAAAAAVRPGVTTGELNLVGARVLAENGAVSAPPKVYKFPGELCISVNEEAIHGIPGRRVLKAGDLVKLDLVAEKDGYFADAAVSVSVGETAPAVQALAACAERAFHVALDQARPGVRVREIGRAVEKETKRSGFQVMRELCGHGVGRTIHEDPQVPNYYDANARTRLTEGLVITIEPIIAAGSGKGVLGGDGWTVRTADGSLSAHYEHTIVVTDGRPILLTA